MGRVHIRVDDFPGTKRDEFWRHNLQNFKLFHFKLRSHLPDDAYYVLGVIPGYTMPVDLQWLASEPRVRVAMHGVVHDESTGDEFSGLRYQRVEDMLHSAKDRLEACLDYRMTDYIPPHNIVNPDTVIALSRLGFERIFGGPETDEDVKAFIRLQGMEYCHSEKPLEYGRSDELLQMRADDHLAVETSSRDVWLTLHWTWEWNIGLNSLDSFLSRIDHLL